MRLAHITTVDLSLRFLLRDQLRAFRGAGFETIGISAPGPWVTELQQDGLIHIAVPALKRRWAPLADLRALAQLVRILRKVRPNIIHTHTPKAGILGRIAGRLAGVPIVLNTVHGLYSIDGSRARGRFVLLLERWVARWSDFEFFQSREDLDLMQRLRVVDALHSAYLGNGVNLQTFDPRQVDRARARARLGIRRGSIVVGTVGRLVWEKGYSEFFAMAEELKRDNDDTVVLVVGPLEPEKVDAVPISIVNGLSQRGVVRFLGMRTDLPNLYAAMDIFVLASHREGFPRSAIEAAAMGLPLILTDIRGCREVVEDGRNGFLVPVRSPNAVLDRVRRLARDPELRARFGHESRLRAKAEFDEQRVIKTTLDVYRRLLLEKQGVPIGPNQESRAHG